MLLLYRFANAWNLGSWAWYVVGVYDVGAYLAHDEFQSGVVYRINLRFDLDRFVRH